MSIINLTKSFFSRPFSPFRYFLSLNSISFLSLRERSKAENNHVYDGIETILDEAIVVGKIVRKKREERRDRNVSALQRRKKYTTNLAYVSCLYLFFLLWNDLSKRLKK